MAASSSTPFSLSPFTDLSFHHHHQPPPYSGHLLFRHLPSSFSAITKKRVAVVSCIISGVDGGGVSDDFVSTRRSVSFDREFSVIANMLKKIEPLDTSVISKGVSDSAKDSMKQTISTMLGLLPSDQFSVMVRVSKRPLDRLLSSSLITGYTLWNAEYRIMLMRNFEISPSNDSKRLNCGEDNEPSEEKVDRSECLCDSVIVDCCTEESERLNLQSCLSGLDPEALNYIQQLESELSAAKKNPLAVSLAAIFKFLEQCSQRRTRRSPRHSHTALRPSRGTSVNSSQNLQESSLNRSETVKTGLKHNGLNPT